MISLVVSALLIYTECIGPTFLSVFLEYEVSLVVLLSFICVSHCGDEMDIGNLMFLTSPLFIEKCASTCHIDFSFFFSKEREPIKYFLGVIEFGHNAHASLATFFRSFSFHYHDHKERQKIIIVSWFIVGLHISFTLHRFNRSVCSTDRLVFGV